MHVLIYGDYYRRSKFQVGRTEILFSLSLCLFNFSLPSFPLSSSASLKFWGKLDAEKKFRSLFDLGTLSDDGSRTLNKNVGSFPDSFEIIAALK